MFNSILDCIDTICLYNSTSLNTDYHSFALRHLRLGITSVDRQPTRLSDQMVISNITILQLLLTDEKVTSFLYFFPKCFVILNNCNICFSQNPLLNFDDPIVTLGSSITKTGFSKL